MRYIRVLPSITFLLLFTFACSTKAPTPEPVPEPVEEPKPFVSIEPEELVVPEPEPVPRDKIEIEKVPEKKPDKDKQRPYPKSWIPEGAKMEGAVFDTPYSVRGITYHRLKAVEKFVQTGLASWYGSPEHGKPTASGEAFNMYAMTAAHKELPLGSRVRVHNLENGRKLDVTINDRGPHVPGRVIDLSKKGAKLLGFLDQGTVKVRVTLLDDKVDGERAREIAEGGYAVQLASFTLRKNAEELAGEYEQGEIVEADVKGKRYFRVRVEGFSDRAEAERFKERMLGEYPGAYVTR
ncbi:septal ring lytic transglycosylase RlpA family protein [Limisalsivibrio acetivorans]|uniref:septal ring lytic transglycosylase RlpA family protein n=1 Tax=Limisalsivibrio acetivorans TaxID=1304888 RepID=UPI0003B4E0A4|nr:septal ring lytic transglycosylase RlpA family protein [Limisalsivibrio acetivorans]